MIYLIVLLTMPTFFPRIARKKLNCKKISEMWVGFFQNLTL